jgi:hypothetical protein
VSVNQPGISFHQVVRPDPYLDGRIDAHIGKENIGGIDQLEEDLFPSSRFQVHRDAAFVAVVAFKIVVVSLESHRGADEPHKSARRIAFFRLNFDYIRPKVAQLGSGNRSLLKHRNFYYTNAC